VRIRQPERAGSSLPGDVSREADIVEEILRIYGYNQVEISEEVHSTLSHSPKPDKARW
jgi:phenylalanyl-tRNA synthetase beta chain